MSAQNDLYCEMARTLPLPQPFLDVLRPPLSRMGYSVKMYDKVFDDVEGITLPHYRIGSQDRSVALLHVMKNVIKDPGGRHFINSLVDHFIDEVIGLFLFSDTNEISEAYEGQANRWMIKHTKLEAAKFLKYEVIERLDGVSDEAKPAFLNNRLLLPRLFPVIPAALATDESHRLGPAFMPELEGLELQSLFGSASNMIDVGSLQGAMRNVPSVCLVRVNNEESGTGFLIAEDLVLTNHHVMSSNYIDDETQIQKNARNTTLHFGYLSPAKGQPLQEEKLQLDPTNPIVAMNAQLDFALLRVEPRIKQLAHLHKVSLAGQPAAERKALNMLQHPGGQVMQLALSGNAVTWVSDDGTRLQYLTPAAKGSSGSPCFNEDWEVVALHHAEETRRFGPFGLGTIRQGIPFKAIYEVIKDHLQPTG
jgi:V8-like Glu-specific endopeptidase